MIKYIGRQLFSLILTLFLISIVIFIIFSIIPGDPVDLLAGVSASEEQVAVLREKLGLNQNMFTRYIIWIKGALCGNFGNSIQYDVPVKELIGERLIVTSNLALLSIFIMLIISIPMGIVSAYYNKKIFDKIVSNAIVIGLSIPNYFLGILIIWLFGIEFQVFIPGKYVDYRENYWGFLCGLFFPALAIAIPKISMMIKFIRTSILVQFRSAYVKTAKSKGESRGYIILHHILRNAIIPIATLLGMIIADALAGSIVIEQVFGIPGIGRLLIGSISSRDFPVVMTLVIYIAFLVVLVNFLVEFLIKINDPRIRVK